MAGGILNRRLGDVGEFGHGIEEFGIEFPDDAAERTYGVAVKFIEANANA